MNRILKVSGAEVAMAPADPEKGYSLAQLKDAIGGGYIEIVRLGRGKILVVDEEGWLKPLPLNITASALAGQAIAGDALLCDDKDVQ